MIYTIGHSTHSKEDFLALTGDLFTTLIDTRSHPGSKWRQWQKEQAERWLPQEGIGYEWWPEIGGWRGCHARWQDEMAEHGVDISSYMGRGFPKQRIAASEAKRQQPAWTNTGLRDYSYFTSTGDFLIGCDELLARGAHEDVAIMCCECQWWRCHRSMISDYLFHLGCDTTHIMPHVRQKNKVKFVDGAKLVRHSSIIGDRLERYEPPVRRAWDIHRSLTGRRT